LDFFCVVPLLCLQNKLIDTDFGVLKYIKKVIKIPILVYFNAQQKTTPKDLVENLN